MTEQARAAARVSPENQVGPEEQSSALKTKSAIENKDSLRFRPARVFLALPAYNEQEALPELLERVGEAFADNGLPYEVIVVDDGSTDDTAKIASSVVIPNANSCCATRTESGTRTRPCETA